MEDSSKGFNFIKKHIFLFVLSIILSVSGYFIYESRAAFRVDFNGEALAYVKNVEVVNKALDFVKGEVEIIHGQDAFYNQEVSLVKVRGFSDSVVNDLSLSNKISRAINIYKPATVISIDNKEALVVESKDSANKILNLIKQPYLTSRDGSEVLDVFFHQKVEVLEKDVLVSKIIKGQDVIMGLKANNNNNPGGSEVVNMTNSFKTVVLSRDFVFDVESINLDVVSIEKEVKTKKIDFKEIKENDATLYKGESKVVTKGETGEKTLVYKTTLINGEKIKSDKVSETLIKEPIAHHVLVGSKARPAISNSNPFYSGDKAAGAVKVAWTQVNNRVPYVFGGSSPRGFDCSGLTSYAYKQVGVYLPHSSASQAAYGSYVSKANLRPGDLVFFSGYVGGKINHVGIYIGKGQMIHAPRAGSFIRTAAINSTHFRQLYVTGRRVV